MLPDNDSLPGLLEHDTRREPILSELRRRSLHTVGFDHRSISTCYDRFLVVTFYFEPKPSFELS
jgi:hypothetical protein